MKTNFILFCRIIRYIIPTIWFNCKYLPLKQAIKLPIILYKPHLLRCQGNIIIEGDVKFAMIRLGFLNGLIYPNNGFSYENNGGTIIFRGKCRIGNDSYLSVGHDATVVFGDDFINNAGAKICSVYGIQFGKCTSLGWNVLILDTNFHPIMDIVTNKTKKMGGEIIIGDYNWFGAYCKVLHSVKTPERCIFALGSIVTRATPVKSYCVSNSDKIIINNVIRTDLN